jgi:hypothetical protein
MYPSPRSVGMRNAYKMSIGKHEGMRLFGSLGIDRRIIIIVVIIIE